jgi:hypothetical protein
MMVNNHQKVINIKASNNAISLSNLVFALAFLRAFFSSGVSAI